MNDQRRDEFGFVSDKALTPNIDRLAKQGVRFTNRTRARTACTTVQSAHRSYRPGQFMPQVRDELVSNIDFASTIFEACGVTAPKEIDLRGRSLLALAKGEDPEQWRDDAYSEIGYTRAVTGEKWKYLAFRVPPSAQVSPEESMKLQTKFLAEVKKMHPWVKWEPNPAARITHTGGPPGGDFLTRLTFNAKPPYLPNYFDPD